MRVARALEALGVPYFAGGSLASSFHGIPRASQDADLVADLRPEHAGPLVAALRDSFYVDDERVRDAIRRRASFNVIHLETLFKVDVFVLKDSALAWEELARRQLILEKLLWYRLGGRASERQWTDVLGELKVKRRRLDLAYLRRWAGEAGVADLLDQALQDAEPPGEQGS